MINNTQFAPTPNGLMHLGHLWLCMLNSSIAAEQSGSFVLCFDDVEVGPQVGVGYLNKVHDDTLSVLDAFDCSPDYIVWLSREKPVLDGFIHYCGLRCEDKRQEVNIRHNMNNQWHDFTVMNFKQVAYWVASDYLHAINPIIQGEDLKPFASQYIYFADLMGLPDPNLIYVPRTTINGVMTGKSCGAESVSSLIKKLGVNQIHDSIMNSCLVEPECGISLKNIKPGNVEICING